MKTKKLTISLTLFCMLAFAARASILVQDNFDSYSTGPLPTNNAALSPWLGVSGTPATGSSGGIQVVLDPTTTSANMLQVNASLTQDIQARLITNTPSLGDVTVTNVSFAYSNSPSDFAYATNYNYGFSTSNSVNALYASMTIYVTALPGVSSSSQTYFTHFTSDGGGFKARVLIVTNGAASGKFRLSLQNAGTAVTNTLPVDLSLNQPYTIVSRWLLNSGTATLWVNPTSETNLNNSIVGSDSASLATINAYGYRQNTGDGVIDIDNLLVGTTFADVVPGSINPPTIITQPGDTNVFAGANTSFKTIAIGDPSIGYQWFSVTNSVTNSISGATSNILTLLSVTTNQTGFIYCMVTNSSGTNYTRSAALTVSAQPIPPTITNQPVNVTATAGDTVNLTVGADGLPAPAYQWKYVTNNGSIFITNNVAGSNVTGTNAATLTFTGILPAQAGNYFCTITNSAGYLTTNTVLANITVNPIPTVSIASFRANVDGSFAPTNTTKLFTIQGTVTTWTNMTTSSTSTEFYMQDTSGGIAVFWSGAAPSTNLPPAGAVVSVTGPMSSFSGLLEVSPVFTNALHNVSVISTGGPLPTPKPLPFDINVNGYPATAKNATMNALESMYFVASNVTLTAGTTFSSGANEPITNNVKHVKTFSDDTLSFNFTNDVGQVFTLFIGASTDIPNKPKYKGPVTIYGILGYFTSAGFEFTPSRYADIVSYVNATNTVTNVKHYGDLLTNSYTENVLRSGETMTTFESIGDPEGGTVTLTPVTDGLPASASWSNVSGGQTGNATFNFTPTTADSGSNYLVSVAVSASTGTSFTNSFTVYVPTTNEQKVAISEFLANPTTNTSLANFNPLRRSIVPTGINTNDQYIEIANQSSSDINLYGWGIYNANGVLIEDFNLNGPTLTSSNAAIIYGGPADGSSAPTPLGSVYYEQSTARALNLPTSGTGTIILRNQNANIIDRVIYSASDLNTNGSLSRFPTIDSAFVPQVYISTNHVTPGAQYDGGTWTLPTSTPQSVANVSLSVSNNQINLNFTANTTKAFTLWRADDLTSRFTVVNGGQFGSTSGAFAETNSLPKRFYFITTQQ